MRADSSSRTMGPSGRSCPPELAERIRRMPKAELHLHVEGAFRWSTVREFVPEARAVGERPPWMDRPFESFDDFRAIFRQYLLPATGTEERIERHLFEVLEDLARQNVRYAEPIFYPPLHMARGLPMAQVLAAARRGVERAQRDHPIVCRLILGLNRGPSSLEEAAQAREIIDLAGPGGWDLVAGLDVMSDDRLGIEPPFVDLYRDAKRMGLRLKVHAGEMGGPEVVRDALEKLDATHLSHGVRAAENPTLVRELAARGIWLHVCPTSNVRLGVAPNYALHPIRRLLNAGCKVTLNSDDPLLFGRSITDEWLCAASGIGLTAEEIKRLAVNAFRASLLPEAERRRFETEIEAAFG